VNQPTVLVLADDPEFARIVLGRWQSERSIPAFTLMGSEPWNGATAGFDLAVVGPVNGRVELMLKRLETAEAPAICIVTDANALKRCHAASPRTLLLQQREGWTDMLVLLATEILRRMELMNRVRRSEQSAAEAQRFATLGRYMLEMRHSLNNALTSVLGNAELLLLEPGAFSAPIREQIETIHTMALRMHEIMQRFSSIETEMQCAEKQSQRETQTASHALASGA
jgi:signal transduction histidine kinase